MKRRPVLLLTRVMSCVRRWQICVLKTRFFLRQKHVTEEEGREQILSNLEEVQRLERLSNNLLALHQYGQVTFVRSPVSIRELVQDAVDQVRATAEAKKVVIATKVSPGKVLVHHESMIQLLDILLDNALKYGASGGHVLIRGHQQSGRYVLAIEDKGPGLATTDIPHLFDRLYRGDKARSTQVAGYGLGLALAKEIADVNNATVAARNNPDSGACFETSLELAPTQSKP